MNDDPQNSSSQAISFQLMGRQVSVSRFTYLLVMGILVGAVTGLVTVVFRKAALLGEEHFFPYHGQAGKLDLWSLPALRRVLMPGVGGLVCGLLLFKIGKFSSTHSIPAILQAVASGQSFFKKSMAIPPLLAIITLATGGSVGPEGPIAEIGSVTGSWIGRVFNVPPKMVKTLIGAGVAAGIAAVFNAPIGGVFFAVEVILRHYAITTFTPIAIAAVVSSVISQAALGNQMAIVFPQNITISVGELPLFVILGLVCGFLSVFFIYSLAWCQDFFGHRQRIPMWLKPAIGGICVGLIGLFLPQVMGEGYDWMRQVIAGEAPVSNVIGLLLLLMAFKTLATGVTLGSGNPGGSFAPAVFVGIMAGAAFGTLVQRLGFIDSASPYAIMGMAGMIAGALGAPITAIMITLRNGAANSSELLIPLMTTVALTAFVTQLFRNISVYTFGFQRRGIDLDQARELDPLSLVRVSSVTHTSDFEVLPSTMLVCDALEHTKDSPSRWYVVQNEQGHFMGIVSLHEMRMAIAEEELAHLLMLEDITDSQMQRLHPGMRLKDALASFSNCEAEVLPVFEKPEDVTTFQGVISRQDALDAYAKSTV